jgi:amino acid transporter
VINEVKAFTRGQTGERELGILGTFSIGIGGIVGGGIFATLGLADSEAHGATPLSFFVGGLIALLTVYSYIQLSLTYPGKGGTVTFINRAFGTGVFTGGLNTPGAQSTHLTRVRAAVNPFGAVLLRLRLRFRSDGSGNVVTYSCERAPVRGSDGLKAVALNGLASVRAT